MKRRGQDNRIRKRALVKCHFAACDDGLVKNMFGGEYECASCNGLGFVDAETGQALPEREAIRQLVIRRKEDKERIRELSRLIPQAPEAVDRQKQKREFK